MLKWVGPFIFTISIFATPSDARTIRNFKVGDWFAGAYTNDASGDFSHCAASARYKSGITVIFSIDRKFQWSIGLYHSDWRLQPGTIYDIAFTVDDLTPISTKAIALNNSRIEVPLADSVELFSKFRKGYVLRIAAVRQVFSFDLTGTSQLLPVLLTCTQNRGAAVHVASNPFESQKKKTRSTTGDDSAAKAEAAVFAANLLSRAGITNFAMLDPNEFPDIKGHVRWIEGSTFGTLNVYPTFSSSELKDLPGHLIGADARACKGTFFSGALPEEANSIVARVFTTCQEGKKPITVYYLAVTRKTGGAYVISTISFGSEMPAKERDTLMRSAVFKLNETAQPPLKN